MWTVTSLSSLLPSVLLEEVKELHTTTEVTTKHAGNISSEVNAYINLQHLLANKS